MSGNSINVNRQAALEMIGVKVSAFRKAHPNASTDDWINRFPSTLDSIGSDHDLREYSLIIDLICLGHSPILSVLNITDVGLDESGPKPASINIGRSKYAGVASIPSISSGVDGLGRAVFVTSKLNHFKGVVKDAFADGVMYNTSAPIVVDVNWADGVKDKDDYLHPRVVMRIVNEFGRLADVRQHGYRIIDKSESSNAAGVVNGPHCTYLYFQSLFCKNFNEISILTNVLSLDSRIYTIKYS